MAYAASKLAKYMHNLGPMARRSIFLKRTLRYLAGTSHRCLSYDFSKPPHLCSYYDGARADDYNTCRSTMYRTSAKAAREAKFLTKIFTSLKHRDAVTPIDLFSDSTGAISMNYNPVHHEANKHCDLADHFAREQVERGIITISHVPTTEMLQVADLLTKLANDTKVGQYEM